MLHVLLRAPLDILWHHCCILFITKSQRPPGVQGKGHRLRLLMGGGSENLQLHCETITPPPTLYPHSVYFYKAANVTDFL